MIIILAYNRDISYPLTQILESLKVEFKHSISESEIINSDKIILPELLNFDKTIRKLQLTNISNVLKIYNKPILSLGNGFCLMSNHIFDKGKKGLCFFNLDIKTSDFEIHDNFVEGTLSKFEGSKLLVNINDGEKVRIKKNFTLLQKNYASSIAVYKDEDYSVTFEYKNYYSLHMDIKHNQVLAEKIIGNFINL